MKKLHLILKKKWFDLIVAGEKTKEFREKKPFWITRLDGRKFDVIHFRLGYNKGAPEMLVECLGIESGVWLDQADGIECFVLKLGKILELKNYEASPTEKSASRQADNAQAKSAIHDTRADGVAQGIHSP